MTHVAAAPLGLAFAITIPAMTLLSLLGRAQSFHDGAVASLEMDNPLATFTLIRGHAENAAALLWIARKPGDIASFYPNAPRNRQITVGRLVNGARSRMAGFKEIYDQLSGFAHPSSASALSSWHASEQSDQDVRFRSKPAFKNDDDFAIACFWLVEIAEASGYLWQEAWSAVLGPDAPPPPEWRAASGT